jgi:hypothetical protein
LEECWPCPVFANYTLAFALQLREKHGKTSVRVAEEMEDGNVLKFEFHKTGSQEFNAVAVSSP